MAASGLQQEEAPFRVEVISLNCDQQKGVSIAMDYLALNLIMVLRSAADSLTCRKEQLAIGSTTQHDISSIKSPRKHLSFYLN